MRSPYALALLIVLGLMQPLGLMQQSIAEADDIFGEGESADEAEPANSGSAGEVVGELLGSSSDSTGPKKTGAWDDISVDGSSETDAAYEQSYEVQVHRELSRDLPKREPFGDKLDDVEQRLGK